MSITTADLIDSLWIDDSSYRQQQRFQYFTQAVSSSLKDSNVKYYITPEIS
jgi:hypothetical protein